MKWSGNIEHFIVTGDTHGNAQDIESFCNTYDVTRNALIILGDAGFNFYLNKTDRKNKEKVQGLNCLIYCVRGNHEERPENLPGILEEYDNIVNESVFYEEQYPNIRYLKDGNIYNMNGYSCLVIGGAYSVDKYYRIARAKALGINPETQWCGWFKGEQLTLEEMLHIEANIKNINVDFVLTHTCPYSWQPFDLFLKNIDQSTVDNTMEKWFDNIKDEIHWKYAWLFGHFHDDRIVRPHVEMYKDDFDSLDEIAQRWENWDSGYQLDWWLWSKLDPCWSFWFEEQSKRIQMPIDEKLIDKFLGDPESDDDDLDDDERAEWD